MTPDHAIPIGTIASWVTPVLLALFLMHQSHRDRKQAEEKETDRREVNAKIEAAKAEVFAALTVHNESPRAHSSSEMRDALEGIRRQMARIEAKVDSLVDAVREMKEREAEHEEQIRELSARVSVIESGEHRARQLPGGTA